MSASMPNISDLVDISETHGDMIPRAGIDYYTAACSKDNNVALTDNYHTRYTIKAFLGFGTRHYCRPEDVPQKETYPKYYECTEKETYAFRKRISDDQYCVVKYSGEESVNFSWETRHPIKDIMITAEAAMSRINTVKEIKLEVGKTYLTEGNYIVHITSVNPSSNIYFTTFGCSPGTDGSGLSINQFLESSACKRHSSFKGYGWAYNQNGEVQLGATNEWAKKLKIVQELPFSIPPAPDGYQYAGGFLDQTPPKCKHVKFADLVRKFHWIKNNDT